MADLSQAEYKVAYATIIKNWPTEKAGKMPGLLEINQAASLGHAHQSNNTIVGAMGIRKGGFTRAQMLAYCPACLNSRKADIEAGLIREISLPNINGKRVYAQVFVKPKVAVTKTIKVAVTIPKATVKPKTESAAAKRKRLKAKATAKAKVAATK